MPKKPKLGATRADGQPALGMKFEQSREKLLKFDTTRANPNLKESIINQVRLHEGEAAANDLSTEVNFKYNEEKKDSNRVDFIHNPNGKLMAPGIDFGKGKIYTWCDTCGERCYIYSVIKCMDGKSISRCSRCGTNCLNLTEEEYELKQEEGNGRKNN